MKSFREDVNESSDHHRDRFFRCDAVARSSDHDHASGVMGRVVITTPRARRDFIPRRGSSFYQTDGAQHEPVGIHGHSRKPLRTLRETQAPGA
jgi:hypothetical protein